MGEYAKRQKRGSERTQVLQSWTRQSRRRNAVPTLVPRAIVQKAEKNSYSNHIQIRDSISTPIQCCEKKVGETKATAMGKCVHTARARKRRESGEFDLVNERFTRQDETPIMVPRTINRTTGVASAKMQYAIPDAVKGPDKGGIIYDDKPLGRTIGKDWQEMRRNVSAYTDAFGEPPKEVRIVPYNPETGSDHEEIVYPASDFIIKRGGK